MAPEPVLKKTKMSEDVKKEVIPDIHSDIANLKDFKVTKILGENGQRKTITLQGCFEGRDGIGIIVLEKKPFHRETINNFFCTNSTVSKDFSNDVYGCYATQPPAEYSEIKTTIIHPASEKHIQKFTGEKSLLVNETPEMYKNVILPVLQQDALNIQWVLNILEHKAEKERIAFEDDHPELGFVLLPDLKWDGVSKDTLYLVAIVKKLGILSMRELTTAHLPLLRNVLEKGLEAIKKKYDLSASEIRVYFHYRPSFYHLHMHFVATQYEAPGSQVDKAHMLSTVINNIEMIPDYYQRATLPLLVYQNEVLFHKLVEHGILTKTGAPGDGKVKPKPSEVPKPSTAVMKKQGASLASVLFEERSQLGICQFHIFFTDYFKDEEYFSIEVELKTPRTIMIKMRGSSFSIYTNSTTLIPYTISNVEKTSKSISFRARIIPESKLSGSNAVEVLKTPTHKYISDFPTVPISGKKYSIVCRKCKTMIATDFTFPRMIVLPDKVGESVEWFCHGHTGSGPSGTKLEPTETDCFLSNESWMIPPSTPLTCKDAANDMITCSGCSNPFGLRYPKTMYLWNCAVIWISEDGKALDGHLSVRDAVTKVFTKFIMDCFTCPVGTRVMITSSKTDLFIKPMRNVLHLSVVNPVPPGTVSVFLPKNRRAINIHYREDIHSIPDDTEFVTLAVPIVDEILAFLKETHDLLPEHCAEDHAYDFAYLFV